MGSRDKVVSTLSKSFFFSLPTPWASENVQEKARGQLLPQLPESPKRGWKEQIRRAQGHGVGLSWAGRLAQPLPGVTEGILGRELSMERVSVESSLRSLRCRKVTSG